MASFPRLLGHCHPETSILRHLEIARNKRGRAVSISRLLGVPSGCLCRGGPHQPSSLRISTTLVDAMDPHTFYHRGSWHGAQETALQRNTTALPLRKPTASTADADAPAAFTAEGPPDFSIHRLQLLEFLPTCYMRAEAWDPAEPLHPQPASASAALGMCSASPGPCTCFRAQSQTCRWPALPVPTGNPWSHPHLRAASPRPCHWPPLLCLHLQLAFVAPQVYTDSPGPCCVCSWPQALPVVCPCPCVSAVNPATTQAPQRPLKLNACTPWAPATPAACPFPPHRTWRHHLGSHQQSLQPWRKPCSSCWQESSSYWCWRPQWPEPTRQYSPLHPCHHSLIYFAPFTTRPRATAHSSMAPPTGEGFFLSESAHKV